MINDAVCALNIYEIYQITQKDSSYKLLFVWWMFEMFAVIHHYCVVHIKVEQRHEVNVLIDIDLFATIMILKYLFKTFLKAKMPKVLGPKYKHTYVKTLFFSQTSSVFGLQTMDQTTQHHHVTHVQENHNRNS